MLNVSFDRLYNCDDLAYLPLLALVRVLYLKLVTQCAILESFGVFLVLADKVSWQLGRGAGTLVDGQRSRYGRTTSRHSSLLHADTIRLHLRRKS